jgi:hypothetical protein
MDRHLARSENTEWSNIPGLHPSAISVREFKKLTHLHFSACALPKAPWVDPDCCAAWQKEIEDPLKIVNHNRSFMKMKHHGLVPAWRDNVGTLGAKM